MIPDSEFDGRHATAMSSKPSGEVAATEPPTSEGGPCDFSVIIPLHNEEDNIEPLVSELMGVLDNLECHCEVVFVDDGSWDQSLERLRRATKGHANVTIVSLRRNFGQTAAIAAGMDNSRGRVIVPMDADLQNDPHDIPVLLEKLEQPPGYDIISGWRRHRHDKWLSRRLPSQAANWLIRKVTGVKLHDFGCTLKAYRRDVLADVDLYSELHRFLPALAAWHGANIGETEVNHRPRVHGKTKYGMRRTIKVLLDLVTVKFLGSYMTKPLYFFGKLGLVSGMASLIVLGAAVAQKYEMLGQPGGLNLNRNVLVQLAALLAFLTVQCILFGIISELLVRIYHACEDRRPYRIRQVYHGDASPPDET